MMAPPWMRVSERRSQRSLRSLRMVCAETSNRRASSSTMMRPEARAMLRISAWRWVSPVTAMASSQEAAWCGGSRVRSMRAPITVNGRRSSPRHRGGKASQQRRIVERAGGGDSPGGDEISMAEAGPDADGRNAGRCGRLHAGAGVLERDRGHRAGAGKAQPFLIRQRMWLAVQQLGADHERLEAVRDAEAGQQQLRIESRGVGHGNHGNAGRIRLVEQRHQARQRLDLPGDKRAEDFFLLVED